MVNRTLTQLFCRGHLNQLVLHTRHGAALLVDTDEQWRKTRTFTGLINIGNERFHLLLTLHVAVEQDNATHSIFIEHKFRIIIQGCAMNTNHQQLAYLVCIGHISHKLIYLFFW